jgi:anti-sigma factor RsiW
MTCAESALLIHPLLDGELDAGHAREVEGHLEACRNCGAQFRAYRRMQQAMSAAQLRFTPPASLRRRIEAALPAAPALTIARAINRRSMFQGFAMGTALSAMAATLIVGVVGTDENQRVLGQLLSAHIRSLQSDHLMDVQSSDRHTVKPWFNGKVDVSPPVLDLTAQGFRLIGGRLDYIDGRAVACIVYLRRRHVINLFILKREGSDSQPSNLETQQGFNIQHWTGEGLEFFAVSDLNTEELLEFVNKFEAAFRPVGSTST